MEYLLISIILLVAFGGILYILPSKRERFVSKLRLEARKSGIVTTIETIPDVEAPRASRVTAGGRERKPKTGCAVWELRYRDDHELIPTWRLLRKRESDGPVDGAVLNPMLKDREILRNVDYWIKVQKTYESMPGLCLGIESVATGVRWLGRENPTQPEPETFVNAMLEGLKSLTEANIEYSQELLERKESESEADGPDE